MKYNLVLIVCLFISCAGGVAQDLTDCQQTITVASQEFEAGHFFGIPSLLKNCLDRGFTDEQKVQAYLLLAQTYLILDDPIAAEDSYLKLLRADPEYVATPAKDPIDVVYLSKKFTATPVFTPHLRIGGNGSIVRTIHEVNTDGMSVERDNAIKPGVQLGVGLDWNINDHISIGGEALFSRKVFKTTRSGLALDDIQTLTERQTWFDFPIYIKYRDNIGNIRPYAYAGFAINLLVTAKGELRTENLSPTLSESGSRVPTEGPDERLTYKRNLVNQSIVAGGGVYYKIGKDFLFADLRYMGGLSNLTDTETNFYAEDGTFSTTIARYRWIGDYFRLDNLALSVGYVKPIYNPRKIKKAKTRKVLKEITK